MTEHDWLTASDPHPLVRFLDNQVASRRRRLLACASARQVWNLLTHQLFFQAIEIAECFADGTAAEPELNEIAKALESDELQEPNFPSTMVGVAKKVAWTSYFAPTGRSDKERKQVEFVLLGARNLSSKAREVPEGPEWQAFDRGLRSSQAALLRDIFGNPFRPVAFDPTWRTPTAVALSQGIYDDRELPAGRFDNGRLGVLADALEDAGCDNADILGHLRGGSAHVRGCWTVELVLGKE